VGTGAAVLLVAVALWDWLRHPAQPPVTALVGLVPLAAAALVWAMHADEAATPTQLDLAAEALARLTASQWRAEAATRGLLDPRPMWVGWRSRSDLADHLENVGAAITGSSDEATSFAADFTQLPRRRLVIVGNAGSGKTTLAVLLLLALVEEPASEHVPVLVSLASWDPSREHLLTWLASRLEQDFVELRASAYGAFAARDLVRTGRILPILDGLDEMPEQLRTAAITAINRALPATSSIVLTCRTAEYESAVRKGDVITAAALIETQPLGSDEAVSWLRSGIPPHRVSAWEPLFSTLEQQPDGPLARALATPLNAWLIRAVCSGPDRDPAELADTSRFATSAMIENYLLDNLVPVLITQGELALDAASGTVWRGTADDASRCLTFLAAHLTHLGTRDFAWWELRRALHPVTARLVISLAVGLCGGLLAGMVFGSRAGLLAGIAVGMVSVFLGSSSASLPGYASFRYRSWKRLSRRKFAEQLAGGLLVGTALGLFVLYHGSQVRGPLRAVVGTSNSGRSLATGVVAGLIGGTVIGIVELLRTPTERDLPASPSSTINSDRRLTLTAGFVVAVISSTLSGLLYGLLPGLLFGLAAGLVTVVIADMGGLLLGRKLVVRAWPMFIIATTVLNVTNDTPRRLMRFLEYAYRIGILRRVGSVYQFRHARLQDRLAAAYQDRAGLRATR
jgi:hypothetical protein